MASIHRFTQALLFTLCALVVGLTLPMLASAQTTTTANSTSFTNFNFPSAVLNDLSDGGTLGGHTYIVPDSSGNVTRSTLRDMVTRGYLMKYRSEDSHLNLGATGSALWLVFPVSTISSSENWALRLGSMSQGRLSTLKQFDLYDLNRNKILYSSQNSQGSTLVLPEKFNINIPLGQTTYLAAYIRTSPGNLTILSPRFENQTSMSAATYLLDKMALIMLGIAIVAHLIMARVHMHSGYLYYAMAWSVLLFHHSLVSSYMYQNIMDINLLTPISWISTFILFAIASWKTLGDNKDQPIALYLGLTGILFISALAAIVLAKLTPNFSLAIEYAPAAFVGLIIAFLTIKLGSKNTIFLNCALAAGSTFLSLSAFSILLLASKFIGTTDTTAIFPQVLLVCATLFSLVAVFDTPYRKVVTSFAASPQVKTFNSASTNTPLPPKKGADDIKDAREKSEHKRLMQVIEQERKAMTEMQIRAAQQTEEMRKSKEAADEATRAKSAFLAVVSHEIRTPMTGIMGMLRLLQDTTLSKEQSEYTTTIKDSGDALLALLNDILDFEKIESGKMELESISFDLKRLLRGIQTLMKGHADFKNINLKLELDPSTPTWVVGDPTRLRQVLLNLINNAIKFTSKGDVTMRVEDLSGKEMSEQRAHSIYFAVKDSGIGISPESQKKLFMPFAQADSSVSRKYGGTGLGLAICKRLIEAMGGNISISSKENEGSTFFFTLRMEAGVENMEDTHHEPAPTSTIAVASQDLFFNHQLKILVVDDNMINLKVVSGFMEKMAVDFTTAGSGKDVLSMIEREKFDAILLDLQLPDMDGIQITKLIRENRSTDIANTPIIAFTGNTAKEDVEACRKAGMNDFAPKPISYEVLVDLMLKADQQRSFQWETPAPSADDNISPLMRHTLAQQPITPPPSPEIFARYSTSSEEATSQNNSTDGTQPIESQAPDTATILDNDHDDDDSFAVAVKQFEEMEKSGEIKPTNDALGEYGLDSAILGSLLGSLGAKQTQDILVSFYDKSDELIAEIGKAFLDNNLPSLYARAHELKGMAANFGFSQLSQLCASIETAAKNSDPASAKSEIDGLGEAYSIARSFLNKWLQTQ